MGIFRDGGKVYKPAADVNIGADSDEFYIHPEVKAPRVAGLLVRIFAWVLESWFFGPLVLHFLKKDNLVHRLVSNAEFQEPPLFTAAGHDCEEKDVEIIQPDLSPPERVKKAADCLPSRLESTLDDSVSYFRRWTIRDFHKAYSSGETSPLAVAKRFLAAVKQSEDSKLHMAFFISYSAEDILKQAEASSRRYERDEPISMMDGVLVAVKDEIDCMPYPTTGGTKWLHKMRLCLDDASCVKQLRLCGAIFVGKTNMHELGAGTSGINPHHGATRNPYDINKVSGGSSSGSAAVVCAGLCPVALGVDGGGSVRMPASLCGVVGFKPTNGRLSHSGVLPLNWTVGMPGIITATVEDALMVYAAISGQLSSSQATCLQPMVKLSKLMCSASITDIKLAKYGKWFSDCTIDIKNCCDQALKMLEMNYGWKTVDVTVPEIEEMRLAHYVTIGSESTASLAPYLAKLKSTEIGGDVRVALSVYGSFSSSDYLNAQRIRNRQMFFHNKIFEKADVIVTPTTGVTAYPLLQDALSSGELDYINGAALVRFSIAGNFLGLPAVTIMVGCDSVGMPIGLQFIGRPWSEATLLHLAFAMQVLCIKSYKKPQVFYDLLKTQ